MTLEQQKFNEFLTRLDEKTGKPLGTSEWFTLTQTLIQHFADITGDHQPIHVNPEIAARSPFGGTIAHGLLTLSLTPQWLYPILLPLFTTNASADKPLNLTLVNYGIDRLRFICPVKSERRVRCHVTLSQYERRTEKECLLRLHLDIEIENEEKPALVADVLTLIIQSE